MKKFLTLLLLLLGICIFIACDEEARVESYELNENGDLIAIYEDGTTKNLGDLETDAINVINTIEISDDGYYILNGVETSIVAVDVFYVDFDTGCSISIPTQKIKDGYKVEKPEIERTGYTLDGWYCNGEKWSFNANVVKNEMTLKAVWVANNYNVSFVTGISQTEEDMTITFNSSYTLPILSRVGYTFNGWEYQGQLVTAEKWNIASDCELIASWTVNKYEVVLDANGGTVEPNKILVEYGKAFTLPIATNEYGAFIGWFYKGKQITDEEGNSLTDWAYIEDIEVTTSWTIELSTVEDLQQLYAYPNGYFLLKNTIDISSNEWIPVGTDVEPFTGVINGGGYAINGLTITTLQGSSKYYGLIGKAAGGEIRDITFNDINILLPAIQNTVYLGGVIGYNVGAEISNVITNGSIVFANHSSTYSSYAGGIIGYSLTDKIQNCINNANVIAKTAAGGILGHKEATAEITLFANNCNNGQVSGAKHAGGMIGEGVFCLASNCKNAGDVVGTKYAGGLFGNAIDVVFIENSYNIGIVTKASDSSNTDDAAGGLVGAVTLTQADGILASIKNSYNQGDIISDQTAGGIIGYCTPSFITTLQVQNCYNSGDIEGDYYVGGIAGVAAQVNISQCANFGTLSGGAVMATICYALPGLTANIVDCYYNCVTTSVDSIQGSKTNEKFSKLFYTEQMFWSDSVWEFFEDKFPELK